MSLDSEGWGSTKEVLWEGVTLQRDELSELKGAFPRKMSTCTDEKLRGGLIGGGRERTSGSGVLHFSLLIRLTRSILNMLFTAGTTEFSSSSNHQASHFLV